MPSAKQSKAKQSKAKLKLELLTLEDRNAAGSLLDLVDAVRWTGEANGPAVSELDQPVAVHEPLGGDAVAYAEAEFLRTPEPASAIASAEQIVAPLIGKRHDSFDAPESATAPQISWPAGGFRIDAEARPTASGSGETAELRRPNIAAGPAVEIFTKGGGSPADSPILSRSWFPPGVTKTETLNNARIKEVTWSGADLITVEADPGAPSYPTGSQWLDLNKNGVIEEDVPGERALPVAYPRDTDVTISAVFTAEIGYKYYNTTPSVYLVKANNALSATQPYYHAVQATLAERSGTEIVMPPTTLSGVFPGSINYGTVELLWQISNDGGISWYSAGVTRNELYVTLATPTVSPVYHTPIYLACSFSATIPATNAAQTVAGIWEKFKDRIITDKDVRPSRPAEKLYYYKKWNVQDSTFQTLLQTKDGNCVAWTQLFGRAIHSAGLERSSTYMVGIEPKRALAPAANKLYLAVNSWQSTDVGTSGVAGWEYQNQLFTTPRPNYITYTSSADQKDWTYFWGNVTEFNRNSGLPGQNQPNPLSLFYNHFIIKIDDMYYDPSYGGEPFAAISDWSCSSLAGIGKLELTNNRVLFKKDPSPDNLRIKPEILIYDSNYNNFFQ